MDDAVVLLPPHPPAAKTLTDSSSTSSPGHRLRRPGITSNSSPATATPAPPSLQGTCAAASLPLTAEALAGAAAVSVSTVVPAVLAVTVTGLMENDCDSGTNGEMDPIVKFTLPANPFSEPTVNVIPGADDPLIAVTLAVVGESEKSPVAAAETLTVTDPLELANVPSPEY